ncbi:hypothetical protein BC830DRAFT_1112322 [Chytriomyces sp. MP71]|nr:hypothetical protein BC830DRAFT_1112322 [Chytriomyces sp. MP71]
MHSAADGARRETVLFFSPLNAIKWRLGRREEEGGVRPSPSLHEKRAVLQPSRPFGQARSYAALKESACREPPFPSQPSLRGVLTDSPPTNSPRPSCLFSLHAKPQPSCPPTKSRTRPTF